MVTTRKISAAALLLAVLGGMAACSREQQDWRAAEGSDTMESYAQFIERHPDSELVKEARAREAQLAEDRDWSEAAKADTASSYQQFLAQHPAGKWAQEARIRAQNFSLAATSAVPPGAPVSPAAPANGAEPAGGSATASSAATGPVPGASPAVASSAVPTGKAVPGEAAVPAGSVVPAQSGPPAPPASLSPTASAPGSPPAPSPQAPKPVALTLNAFGIQLGAFTSEDRANAEWRTLQARFATQLQGLAPQVIAADTASGRVFRLQALGGDEARARLVCEQLRALSQGCVPVVPH